MSLSSLLFPPVVELERVCTDKVPGSPPPPRSLYSGEGINNLTFVIQLQQLFSATSQLAAHQDNTVCACSIWLMGQVQHSVSHTLTQQEKGEKLSVSGNSCKLSLSFCMTVPSNYGYLPDTSILSSMHSLLESLSRK